MYAYYLLSDEAEAIAREAFEIYAQRRIAYQAALEEFSIKRIYPDGSLEPDLQKLPDAAIFKRAFRVRGPYTINRRSKAGRAFAKLLPEAVPPPDYDIFVCMRRKSTNGPETFAYPTARFAEREGRFFMQIMERDPVPRIPTFTRVPEAEVSWLTG